MREQWTVQQRIWIWGKTFFRAMGPLALYVLMPALCLSLGYVILHPEMMAQEFFTYGGNFYSAVGMLLTILILYGRSRSKKRSFFEDTTLYFDQMDIKKAAAFLVFGVSAALAVSAFLTLLPKVGLTEGYSEASHAMFNGRDMLFTILTTVITAPLAEEIIFRGYMMNIFLETFEEKQATWIVSLIFAVCHGQALWILYALVMGLEEKAPAPETIPERMEFGYLPDGWTITWDETADTEKTCRATLSDENGPQLWVFQYPLAYEMETISYEVTDLSPEERQEFQDVIESQGADGLRAFAEEHGLAPGAERMEQSHKTLDSITDLTANMLNDRVGTLSWATPDCWYYVTLAGTDYETVDRDTVLRILQGITP